MSSDPFISNDNFIFYSDIRLTQQYAKPALDSLFAQFVNREYIVIFLATEFLENYLYYLLTVQTPFVLITTCNDDPCIPYYHYPCRNPAIQQSHDALLAHPPLLRWATKNPSILHPKLMPIPLGPKWQYTSRQFFGEDKEPILKILRKHCMTPLENFRNPSIPFRNDSKVGNINKKKLLYFHFGQTTDDPFYSPHKGIRQKVLEICQKEFALSAGADFENYLVELGEHRFALSPPGRGLDTHRTWEALMVGTIPIVIRSPLDSMYDKLPVLIVDDWSVLTREFLEEKYVEFQGGEYQGGEYQGGEYQRGEYQMGEYDFSRLYAPYWKEAIQKGFALNK